MLSALFTPKGTEERAQASTWGDWPGEGIYAGGSSNTVNARSSLQLLTVYGCVRLITDSIATLPVITYRVAADGTKVEFPTPAWVTKPTPDLTFGEWCSQVLSSLLLHGNAYLNVLRGGTTGIVEVQVMDPMKVQVRREAGRKVFYVNGQPFPGEMLHIAGLMLPGSDMGLSPVDCAREAIGLGLSTQTYGNNYFESEGNMPGVIEIPTKVSPGGLKDIADVWQRKRSRRNRGLPGVLDGGATWKPTGITNEAAQFLATRNYTAAEIAGQMFLVDPSDLGIAVNGTSLTYGNLEQRNARRVQVTLLPWIVRIEQAISTLLRNPQYMKFNVDGLLRGDVAARWSSYKVASEINTAAAAVGQPPVLLTSEMRRFEDLDPLTPEQIPTAPESPEPPMQVEQMNAAPLPNISIHMPEYRVDSPVVNVAMPEIRIEQQALTINVPEQPAPIVNVTNDAPVVNVSVPESRAKTQRIEHDANGRIAKVVTE